jgi:hypothetical protein
MAISSINSMESSLALMASAMQEVRVPQELGFSVLKQIMDTQANQAQALLQMINSGPSPTLDGTGQIINIGA